MALKHTNNRFWLDKNNLYSLPFILHQLHVILKTLLKNAKDNHNCINVTSREDVALFYQQQHKFKKTQWSPRQVAYSNNKISGYPSSWISLQLSTFQHLPFMLFWSGYKISFEVLKKIAGIVHHASVFLLEIIASETMVGDIYSVYLEAKTRTMQDKSLTNLNFTLHIKNYEISYYQSWKCCIFQFHNEKICVHIDSIFHIMSLRPQTTFHMHKGTYIHNFVAVEYIYNFVAVGELLYLLGYGI